ncbi:MAG: calcium/sodium antiporter [Candidatus Uhrbacteria bacterium]|nr:calcium/sodium antiporter [Patescibacteria group bacterium]MBU1907225.1 calcium/sodium antiporter [Patescibacteria group bacterium]
MTISIITSIFFLLAGFFILIKGADYLIRGSSSIASHLKISPLVIGLTIVAFGTSAPELAVNVYSAVQGANQLAIGNILGSNIANILLVLGIAAMIRSLSVRGQTVTKEIPFSLLAAVMVLIAASDIFLDHAPYNVISRTDGLAFLGFFIIFLYYSHSASKQVSQEVAKPIMLSRQRSFFYAIGGLVALFIGGRVIVDNAVNIAEFLNISQTIIGLTVVALGTSLPELVTSIVAIRKGEVDLAVGNIIGSNIFNIFFVLGLTATVAPIPFEAGSHLDAIIAIAASLVLFGAMFVGERHRLERWVGALLVLSYISYITFRVVESVV